MDKNTIIETIVSDFAKKHKFSKAKSMQLAHDIIEVVKHRGGKTASEETIQIRGRIESMEKGIQFTAKTLASKFQTDAVSINNSLRHLQEKGIVQIAGKEEKQPGQRGRAALIWQTV